MNLTFLQYFIVTIISLIEGSFGGSCKSAKLCCQGRDSGCVIQKASPNAIIESPKDKPCYCDHACLKLNDCCDDFRETCAVIDCAVGDWEEWSDCNNQCGIGIQTRLRAVTQFKQNGGKHCPQLEQSRICQGTTGCRHKNHSDTHVVKLKPWSEVISNSSEMSTLVKGVCSTFTVIWVSRACHKDFPSLALGEEICVICQIEPKSVSCQNEENLIGPTGVGRWKIIASTSIRCHGQWIMSTNIRKQQQLKHECDSSNCHEQLSFLLI